MHRPRRHNPVVALLLGTVLLTGCQTLADDVVPVTQPGTPTPRVTQTGAIQAHNLREISGLAAATGRPDRLWAVNDSLNAAELCLLATDGRELARYPVNGVSNVDWEDLAVLTWRGVTYLVIADIGDNRARRDSVRLHFVREPAAAKDDPPGVIPLTPDATLHFRYVDGPRDAEGVAVDPLHGEILVLSKRENQPMFYRLPLRLDTGDEVLVAERLAPLLLEEKRFDPPGGPVTRSLYGASPTALELDGRGESLLLLTYTALYRLQRGADEAWKDALQRPFLKLAEHPLRQAEALAVDVDGRRIWFTTEGLPAPLWRIDLDAE